MMEMEMNVELEREGGSEADVCSAEGSSTGSVYCTLEQEFSQIRNEMRTNKELAAYESGYTRLYESLYKANQLEEELTQKCKTLQEELTDGTNKISSLEKKVVSFEKTVDQLNKELLDSKSLADVAHVREQKAQEVIENLRISVYKLTEEINQKTKQLSTEDQIPSSKEKDSLAKDHERLLGEVDTLKQRLKSVVTFNQEMENKLVETEQEVSTLQDNIVQLNNELMNERREREKVEFELQDSYVKYKMQATELQTVEESAKEATNNALKQEKLLVDRMLENEKYQKEIQRLMLKETTLKASTDKLEARIEESRKLLIDKSRHIKDLTREINRYKEDLGKLKSEKENIQSKLTKEMNLNTKSEDNYKRASVNLRTAELEIAGLKRCIESEKKVIEKLTREKDSASKNVIDLEEINAKLSLEIRLYEQNNRKLQISLENLEEKKNEMNRQVKKLENEKDRYILHTQELTQQVEEHIDNLKMKQFEIVDYQKRLLEAEAKLRQQQTIFEDIRAERNNYKKNLAMANESIIDLKSRIKNSNIQLDYIKEQYALKEADLLKQEFLYSKLEKEKESLKVEISNIRKNMSNLREQMEKMKQEAKLLRNLLQEADMNLSKQTKEMDSLMNERDLIGTQIVRRNDELSLQYNKIQILTETLAQGEKQYTQRMEEIRMLKLELKSAKLRIAALEKNTTNLCSLRAEVLQLERCLNQERVKVTALEEEVQNPLNIHRWRSLEGSDPDMLELIKKIQILQKRILKMSNQMVVKERKIYELEKVYAKLRDFIAKQPGPEVLVQLNKTRQALRNRGNKMKSLVAELNIALTSEHKFELDAMKKELEAMKFKYFNQKKKNTKPADPEKPNMLSLDVETNKFVGGGFNMSKTASKSSTATSITINK